MAEKSLVMPFNFPIKIRHDPIEGEMASYYDNLRMWWKIADHVFKFTSWCLIAGLIGSAAIKLKSVILAIITLGLDWILYVVCLKIFIMKFEVTLRGKALNSRLSKIISVSVGIVLTLSLAIGGLYASNRVAGALFYLQTVKMQG